MIDGLVNHPVSIPLADLKHRAARRAVDFTLERSGNTGLPFFSVASAMPLGQVMAPLLREAGIKNEASEVVFSGRGQRGKSVTIRGTTTGPA